MTFFYEDEKSLNQFAEESEFMEQIIERHHLTAKGVSEIAHRRGWERVASYYNMIANQTALALVILRASKPGATNDEG